MELDKLLQDEFEPPAVVSGPFIHEIMVNTYFGRKKVGAGKFIVFRVGCIDIWDQFSVAGIVLLPPGAKLAPSEHSLITV